jgi:pimeloyl-ACP methyl ester carboxylesterase
VVREADLDARIARFPAKRLATPAGFLSYRESGEGAPAVLLHGISSGSASWLFQLESWPDGLHRIAWDAPGYGCADPLHASYPSVADYVASLRTLLCSVGRGRLHLVGHSLGALIAAAYCRLYPETVCTLSLLSPALGYGSVSSEVRNSKRSARVDQMRRLGPHGFAIQRTSALVSPGASKISRALISWNVERLSVPAYVQAVYMLSTADLLADLRTVAVPVLVVSGEVDTVTPPSNGEAAAAACRNSRLVILKGVGHASPAEAPELVRDTLVPFIMKH